MIRDRIKVRDTKLYYELPKEYINKEIEIIIFELSEVKKLKKNKKSFAGAFRKYSNNNLIEKEKDIAWAEIARNKEHDIH